MIYAANGILSLALAMLAPALWGGDALSRPLLRLALGLGLFALLELARRRQWYERRLRRFAWGCGLLFGAFTAWGTSLAAREQIEWGSPLFHLAALLCCLGWTSALMALWTALAEKKPLPDRQRGTGLFRHGFGTALLLLLCWLPCFLAIFPGNFVYDTGGEYDQCAFGYNSAFPRLHSWLNINIIHEVYGLTGSYTAGVAVFTLLHMTLLAALFAWILRKLQDFGVHPVLMWLSFGWFALFPTVQMLAVSPIRDLMFSGFLTAALFFLLLMLRDRTAFWHSRMPLGFGLSLAFTILSRNNNASLLVYLLLFGACLLIFLAAGKGNRLGAGGFAASALVCYFGLSAALALACQPFEQVHTVSALAPLTQPIVRSYLLDDWGEQEQEEFAAYFDTEELEYTPNDGDISLSALKGLRAGERGASGFVRLWLGAFLRHPGTFLDAWLENTRCLWMPNAVIDGYVRSGRYEGFQTAYFYYTGEIAGPSRRVEMLPRVHDYYQRIGTMMSFETIPVLRLFFSIGFHFWLLLAAMFYWGWRRMRRFQGAFCPLLLYALINSFCPLMLVRYFAALFFCFPLLLVALLQPERLLGESAQQ